MSSPPHSPNMSASASFSSLARSKLHVAVGTGSRDNCNLHRWVLLKNSITQSSPSTSTTAPPTAIITSVVVSPSSSALASASTSLPAPQYEEEEDGYDQDAFLFPETLDVDDASQTPRSFSEAEWLDSLLESLGNDDDDDDDSAVGVDVYRVLDEEEDDYTGIDFAFTPLSSSDDLMQSASFAPYPPTIYPPYHPPILRSFPDEDEDRFWYRQYRDPLPYLSYENGDDLDGASTVPPVPDAVPDDSDDDSDAPSSPYVDTPTSSYIIPGPSHITTTNAGVNVIDPALIPLPLDEHDRARPSQQGYFDIADAYFYPFELDPPRADARPQSHSHHHLYNPYHQDC